MKRWVLFGLLLLLVLSLSACAQNDPASTIETYLKAKVDSDLDRLLQLSCADWESQAVIEASSFESMNAELQGMECQTNGEAGDFTLVECSGKIHTVYNGETREWDLGIYPYQVSQVDGEWRMCGYHEAGR